MKRNWIVLAFLLAVALAGALAFRIGQPTEVPDTDIREVWEHHPMYEGVAVRVSGTLKRFLAGLPKDHYAVESADGYRIGVESSKLEQLVGREVHAEGKVVFDEERGLRLAPATVEAR